MFLRNEVPHAGLCNFLCVRFKVQNPNELLTLRSLRFSLKFFTFKISKKKLGRMSKVPKCIILTNKIKQSSTDCNSTYTTQHNAVRTLEWVFLSDRILKIK